MSNEVHLGYADTFVIKGQWDYDDQDFLYWSNKDGWVDLHSSTVFNGWELNDMNFPDESTSVGVIMHEDDKFIISKQIPMKELS